MDGGVVWPMPEPFRSTKTMPLFATGMESKTRESSAMEAQSTAADGILIFRKDSRGVYAKRDWMGDSGYQILVAQRAWIRDHCATASMLAGMPMFIKSHHWECTATLISVPGSLKELGSKNGIMPLSQISASGLPWEEGEQNRAFQAAGFLGSEYTFYHARSRKPGLEKLYHHLRAGMDRPRFRRRAKTICKIW